MHDKLFWIDHTADFCALLARRSKIFMILAMECGSRMSGLSVAKPYE
jgi:hypothetical protein